MTLSDTLEEISEGLYKEDSPLPEHESKLINRAAIKVKAVKWRENEIMISSILIN
jgi:hypothetical protein